MSFKEHPNYNEEIDRLEYTIKYIEDAISAAQRNRKSYKGEIREAFKHLKPSESSESYISILLNSQLLQFLEKNFDGLLRARRKPYFCRIDFRQEDSSKIERIYIGKMSLSRAEDNIPLIVDWRSPIASVYYEGRLGEVSYSTQTDTINGELYLKRQYTINDGELENILDIDITATDTFLQASLEANADSRLKDIVSTIQAEQNEVIRSDISKPLIVQGAAGSGKTTIALHRIAYLIYTYEETFDSEDFMIIAPNRLFLNYISEVLPELGVEKVKQTTMVEFMLELIGNKYKVVDTNQKLISLINEGVNDYNSILVKEAAAFKGSLAFKEIIDKYVEEIEQTFVPRMDFTLEDYVIFDYEYIRNLFINEYNYLPLYKRLNEIKKNLSSRLKIDKKKIIENIENYFDKQIEHLRYDGQKSEQKRRMIVELIDKRDKSIESIKKSSRTLIAKYLSKFPKIDLFDYYRDIFTDKTRINYKQPGEELVNFLCDYSLKILDNKQIEFEDLAALVYLEHRVFGFEKKLGIKYVVIDEAQDLSLFQFYTLKDILDTNLFTILGDLSQGIHSYRAISDWDEVSGKVFDDKKSRFLTLKQSYRTTIEIMNLANKVISMCPIPGLILAKPVVRHGQEPGISKLGSENEIIKMLENSIEKLQKEGYKSVAVICKTLDECKRVKKHMDKNKKVKLNLLSGEDKNYSSGIVILPSYIAKGLEFDVVIIVNIEETYTDEELDLKLLYVAMTRALHKLYVFYTGNTIPILDMINLSEK